MDVNQLAAQLTIDEGRRKRIYQDTVGKWTAGVGRNLTDRDFSDDEIDLMLRNDIDLVCDQLDNRLPWWKTMSEQRMQALCNFVFNVGITTALTFKNTLSLLQSREYDKAANEILKSKWASQVGQRAIRIAEQIRNG